ncbi:MAG TPA: hypothetical protein VIE65_11635 [Methylobacter sp.]|jgi:hypothetical protein
MNKRPTSVTVISWILIVTCLISLVASALTINNPMSKELMTHNALPIPAQIAILFIGLFISITCGIAMLQGKGWGRTLYTGWSAIGIIIGLINSPMKLMMIPSYVFLAIIFFFLYRPHVTEYFKTGNPEAIAGDA